MKSERLEVCFNILLWKALLQKSKIPSNSSYVQSTTMVWRKKEIGKIEVIYNILCVNIQIICVKCSPKHIPQYTDDKWVKNQLKREEFEENIQMFLEQKTWMNKDTCNCIKTHYFKKLKRFKQHVDAMLQVFLLGEKLN